MIERSRDKLVELVQPIGGAKTELSKELSEILEEIDTGKVGLRR